MTQTLRPVIFYFVTTQQIHYYIRAREIVSITKLQLSEDDKN